MGRPGETEEERRIRKDKERRRRREKEKLKEGHSDERDSRKKRDRDHETEKKDLRKRESSGDVRRRKRDETEEERKIRKEKERRERKERENRESGSAKTREPRDRKEKDKSRKHEKSRRDETSEERRIRKEKKRKEEKKSRSEGYLAPTKSKSMKESETKHTYDRKIDENIDAEPDNDQPTNQKPEIYEQGEIDEEYDDDFDDYEDDFEVFEPNKSVDEKENKIKVSSKESSPDAVLDFDYSSLQRAMKREVSEASIKSQEAAAEARRKKLSEINRPVSSSTPESEPIHTKKTIEKYVNKSRKLYPNERRAREIQKLITFDSRLGSYKSADTDKCHLETSKFVTQ